MKLLLAQPVARLPKSQLLSEVNEAIQATKYTFGGTALHHAGQYAVLGEEETLQNNTLFSNNACTDVTLLQPVWVKSSRGSKV